MKNMEQEIILKNIKMLVAEDDDVTTDFINTILSGKIKEILFVKNGLEAVDIFRKNQDFDIILMDTKMPVMDGLTATKKIREISQTIPIISQTAFAFPDDRILSLKSGCNDYISKPFRKDDLFAILLKNLREKQG